MTTITPQQSFQNLGAAMLLEGAALVLAAGMTGKFSRPLGAGPLAFAMLPSLFNIRCGSLLPGCRHDCPVMPEPQANWTAQMTGQNTAKVDIGDGYQLQIDERSSEVSIVNTATGQSTRIWGDPHVDVNGKHQFDFYGTTTFELANGTKITINTEQWSGNPNAYVASQIVVTKGSNAIVVDGISQNKLGDLSVTMSNDGYALDAANRDGFTVHESASGWRTECGGVATQDDANLTRPGELYGPGSNMMSLAEAGQLLGGFLLFGMFANMFQTGHSDLRAHHRHHPLALI